MTGSKEEQELSREKEEEKGKRNTREPCRIGILVHQGRKRKRRKRQDKTAQQFWAITTKEKPPFLLLLPRIGSKPVSSQTW